MNSGFSGFIKRDPNVLLPRSEVKFNQPAIPPQTSSKNHFHWHCRGIQQTCRRFMDNIILWVYIVMLVVGGLMGFLKAGSKASLIASVGFAIPLTLAALAIVPSMVADICLVVLLIFFGKKYVIGRKFMPAGLMTILSIVALALRFF
jgi:uncharacterized membrane protein (UPF0136 family)